MRDGENIRQVSELGVDYIGFIFWNKSPRYVTMRPTHAGIIPDRANSQYSTRNTSFQRVGVFVDEMPQSIITRVVNFGLDVIQLHGHETPTMIRNLRATLDPDLHPGIQIWKALSIPASSVCCDTASSVCCDTTSSVCCDTTSSVCCDTTSSVCCDTIATSIATLTAPYESCVDAFVFDTQSPSVGGSGQQFDWSVLSAYQGSKPFLLSGGIGPEDAERIKSFHHPQFMGIDLNSRFETEPGMKNIDEIKQFLSKL